MVEACQNFVPVTDRLVLKLEPKNSETAGGLILADDTFAVRNVATVLAIGPEVKADVAVGDRVMFHCFDELPVWDGDIVVIRDKSLLFKF